MIAILVTLPLCFLAVLVARKLPGISEHATLRLVSGKEVISVAFFFVPAFLTTFEILANPNPIRLRGLFHKWRDSKPVVLSLR